MRALVTTLVFLAAATGATLLDRVAVTVGREAITEGEVLEDIRLVSFLNGEPPDFSADARRKAAGRLVDQYLIEQEMEASRYPRPSDSDTDKMLGSLVQSRFHGDAAFRQELQRRGITELELKARLRRQLAILRFTDQRFSPEAPPQPQARGDAERAAPGATETSAADRGLEEWLQQARSQARIVYKKEAFQ